jgi:histidyl-tRNA synthetase
MAKSEDEKTAPARPAPRLPKGLRDIGASEIREQQAMLAKIREVYERYGFEPLETPAIEYTDALGKFLPDQDRPNEGVFSFQDEDEQWLSLRYDLTAPLARYVAENFDKLPKPFRRYATGSVFRNEKPGPGRFRQFTQFDADTVGTESIAADAEMCMLAADTLEALGIARGDYVIKVNNRKVLDGVRQAIGLDGPANDAKWLTAMRALDKFDRLGREGVGQLLGAGRKDESGDFTPGAGLEDGAIGLLKQLLTLRVHMDAQQRPGITQFNPTVQISFGDAPSVTGTMTSTISKIGGRYYERNAERDSRQLGLLETALGNIEELDAVLSAAGYGDGRVIFDTSVVRGLEYYTGPVFEAELTFEVKNEDGQTVRFGSVGGGGRYDDLVARFTGQKVPATGFSIGVSRLQAALASLGKKSSDTLGPVVVLVMDKAEIAAYQKMTQMLRSAGIRAEMYLGSAGMKAQMKYADKRGSPLVVIQGSDERAKGEVTLKDLIEGAKAAAAIKDNKEWKEARPAQVSIPETDLVAKVRELLARHES